MLDIENKNIFIDFDGVICDSNEIKKGNIEAAAALYVDKKTARTFREYFIANNGLPRDLKTKEFFKEDVVNLLGGASSILNSFREEVEERIKDRVEKVINKLDIIDKEEFLILKEMVEKSRIENNKLHKKISILESKIKTINRDLKNK